MLLKKDLFFEQKLHILNFKTSDKDSRQNHAWFCDHVIDVINPHIIGKGYYRIRKIWDSWYTPSTPIALNHSKEKHSFCKCVSKSREEKQTTIFFNIPCSPLLFYSAISLSLLFFHLFSLISIDQYVTSVVSAHRQWARNSCRKVTTRSTSKRKYKQVLGLVPVTLSSPEVCLIS